MTTTHRPVALRRVWSFALGLSITLVLIVSATSVNAQFTRNQTYVRTGVEEAQESPDSIRGKIAPVLLREGTEIGPISGRMVMRSQRWVFVPKVDPHSSAKIQAAIQHDVSPYRHDNHEIQAVPFEQIIVLENLMLSRIEVALENDFEDDRWVITGRITEFRDENRLILMTAQRASKPR